MCIGRFQYCFKREVSAWPELSGCYRVEEQEEPFDWEPTNPTVNPTGVLGHLEETADNVPECQRSQGVLHFLQC